MADEFMVVDDGCGTAKQAKELYQRIRGNIDVFIEENDYKTVYTISAGVMTGADMWKIIRWFRRFGNDRRTEGHRTAKCRLYSGFFLRKTLCTERVFGTLYC